MYEGSLDIENVRTKVLHETKFRDTLGESCNELAAAIADLEDQKYRFDDQSGEWKTRCEIQQEINEQLRKQSLVLHDKVAKAAKTSQDFQKSARANAAPVAFGATSEGMLDALDRERRSLSTQLLNIELRVEQEAKAYHKANEERKAIQLEIGSVNSQLKSLKTPPTAGAEDNSELAIRGSQQMSQISKSGGAVAPKNIPPNQRVIDPKLGPIKKTAAVKQLPPM